MDLKRYITEIMSSFDLNFISLVPSCWWLMFPVILALFVLYKLIRPYFPVNVNCWFCNTNQIVTYSKRKTFSCYSSSCGQYNGFKDDGSYNKVIEEQHCHQDYPNILNYSYSVIDHKTSPSDNALCRECNLKQQRKMDKLKCFTPTREEYFQQEYRVYSRRLEQIYELCNSCRLKTSIIIQEQDTYLKNMYFSTPLPERPVRSRSLITQISPVPCSASEKQRSQFQRQMDVSFSPKRFHNSQTSKRKSSSTSLVNVLMVFLKLTNLFLSLIVLVYVACQYEHIKTFVAPRLTQYTYLKDFANFLFGNIQFLYLSGIVTQGFVSLRLDKVHLGELFLWIVTSLFIYNHHHHLYDVIGLHEYAHLLVVCVASVNSFMSTISLLKELPRKRTNPSKSGLITLKQSKSHHVSKTPDNKKPTHVEEHNKLFAALKVSPDKHGRRNGVVKETFFFLDHKVSTREFKERLHIPSDPRPLISPPKFVAPSSPQPHNFGFKAQFLRTKMT